MPGQVIGKSLNMGYPGSDSHSSDTVKINRFSKGKIPFGAAVALNGDNTVSAFGADNTQEQFLGIAVREVKQQTDIYQPAGAYNNNEPTDVLVRGSVIVAFNGVGKPTAGGKVYIRIAKNSSIQGAEIGDIEAEADGDNTLLLPNIRFTTGRTDASEVVEVTVLERQI